MDLADVMDQVAAQAGAIEGLRVFAYPPDSVTPPALVVSYPTEVSFDETYGRGMDRMSLELWVVIDRPTDRSARDRLSKYCAGSGAHSVKHVLESGAYSAFDTLRVEGIDFQAVSIGGIEYMGALFTLDIAGPGSS